MYKDLIFEICLSLVMGVPFVILKPFLQYFVRGSKSIYHWTDSLRYLKYSYTGEREVKMADDITPIGPPGYDYLKTE